MPGKTQRQLNRRDILKITAVTGGLVVGNGVIKWLTGVEAVEVRERRLLMGTIINLTVVAESWVKGQAAIAATYPRMEALIGLFDTRRNNGQLAQLNQAGELEDAPAELIALLREAIAYGDLTDGAFEITIKPVLDAYEAGKWEVGEELALVDYRRVQIEDDYVRYRIPGMQVTLDGIAKGRVVDGAIEVLRSLGFNRVLVEAGGDLFANGKNQEQKHWGIAVLHPRATEERRWLTTLRVSNQAVATSGDYLNSFTNDYSLHHIIDPHRGISSEELSSVTIVAPTTTQADALGTAVMVIGIEKGLALVEQLSDIECLVVTKALNTYQSSGFPSDDWSVGSD